VKRLVDYSLDHGQTPTNFVGFSPEFASALATANWRPHPASPAEVNGQLTITNPLSARTGFYRLKQP
jgi:hypothetical protein